MSVRMLVLSAIVAAGCGGRTGLTPFSKIGRLSDSAVRAVEHGVTIVVRTEDWNRQAPDRPVAIPLRVTIDNGSTRRLLVQHRRFALVDTGDQAVVRAPLAARDAAEESLSDRVLAPGNRVDGLLYCERVNLPERVTLTVDLIDASTGQQVGTIDIPLEIT